MTDTIWHGALRRGPGGTLVGELTDRWGWRVEITGVFNEQLREYELTGVLGDPPTALRVAAIDEPAA